MRTRAILALAAIVFLSCSKKVIPVITPPPPSIEIQEIDFEYFHGKARLVFKDDKKEQDIKANIRIRKDSVIWMTFTFIGLQGGKALINQDSVTIVRTVDKEYFVFTYPELSRRFNLEINYHTLQSAILGNLISPRSDNDKISPGEPYNLLEQERNRILIRNYINPTTKKLEKVEMREQDTNNLIQMQYADFQPVGDKIYPYHSVINVLYRTVSGLVNTTITLEYNKAEVGDKELKFPFNIPRKYERR